MMKTVSLHPKDHDAHRAAADDDGGDDGSAANAEGTGSMNWVGNNHQLKILSPPLMLSLQNYD